MYDMYPWDSADQGDYPPTPLRSWRDPSAEAPVRAVQAAPARAVQAALDRSDNGGHVAAGPAQPAASPARQ